MLVNCKWNFNPLIFKGLKVKFKVNSKHENCKNNNSRNLFS